MRKSFTAHLFRAVAGAVLLLLGTASCHSDGPTTPSITLTLAPGSAAPYSYVAVEGLPASFDSAQVTEIQVGGVATQLTFDAAAGTHGFLVPDLAPGSVAIVIPNPAGGRAIEARIQVLPVAFRGGSATATLDGMDVELDSLQVALVSTLRAVVPEQDSAVTASATAAVAAMEALQAQVDAMTPADQADFAAAYSAHAPLLEEAFAILSELTAELQALPPVRGSAAVSGAAPAVTPVATLVSDCVRHVGMLDRMERVSEILGRISTILNTLAIFGGPHVQATVGILTLAATGVVDVSVMILNSLPRLLVSDGLRFEVSPVRVEQNGKQGTMTPWVRRRAAGALLGTPLEALLGTYGAKLLKLESARAGLSSANVRRALRALGLEALLELSLNELDRRTSDYIGNAIGSLAGDVAIPFNDIQFTQGVPSPAWSFVGATGSVPRSFQTNAISEDSLLVTVAAQVGTVDRCRATTSPALTQPRAGINGFVIRGGSDVEFVLPTPTLEVRPGSSGAASVQVRNRRTSRADGLVFRIGPRAGGWSAPPGLQVSLTAAPSSLAASGTGTVRLAVTAASTASERTHVIPITLEQNGTVLASADVAVEITPQLTDVVVNRGASTIRLWDHAIEDGDLIDVTLNGAPLVTGFRLTNAGSVIPVQYRPGRNVLTITALNEGDLVPNTAALGLADVILGSATQSYDLPTGGQVFLSIRYDPPSNASASTRGARLPDPTYTSCAEGERGDCRPR